ncbi:hypothetical protein [Vibrio vulnificus YJ016]|uniref:Uncharacterized protein n=2 Tax=Vibrio vulnificus TaxID=672 RepID=Q7MBU8_VIBVY|nr:hypothetical protein [Vibrio vulnificus YJ016]
MQADDMNHNALYRMIFPCRFYAAIFITTQAAVNLLYSSVSTGTLKRLNTGESMQTVMIKYQPFGIGEWTTLYVSTDVANALEKEYMSYGWPVEVNSECTELESDFA